MEDYQQHIGKEMNFNEKAFTYALHAWSRHVAPAIIALRGAYEALNLGPFTHEVFTSLLKTNGIQSVQEAYTAMLNEDVASLNLKSLALKNELFKSIPDMITELRIKRDAVYTSYQLAQNYGDGEAIALTWENISIKDGGPALDEKAIREAATKRITTQFEAEVYQKLTEIKDKYDEFINLVETKGITFKRFNISFFSDNDFLLPEPNSRVSIKPAAPFVIDSLLHYHLRQEAEGKRIAEEAARRRENLQKQWDSATHDLNGKPYANA